MQLAGLGARACGGGSLMNPMWSLLLGFMLSASVASADPCADQTQKLRDSGVEVVSCTLVDFGVKAISADYQKLQTQPVGVKPVKIREDLGNGQAGNYVHVNEAPAIRNSAFFNPVLSPSATPAGEGASLIQKFTTALQVRYPQDPALVGWMSDPDGMILSDLKPRPEESNMSGRCHIWSAWSLDPSIRESLSRMSNGILCNEVIPFTRGELKELITVLYPAPPITQRRWFSQMYTHPIQYPWHIEDANLALTRLGELGGGTDFSPDGVIRMAQEAKSRGENLIMDIDPGREIWNQPVEWVMDVVMVDPSHPPTATRTSAEFGATEPAGKDLLSRIRGAELELTALSLRGDRQNVSSLCSLRKSVGLECASGFLGLGDQVDALREVRDAAVSRGTIQLTDDRVVRHKLFISYGVESAFGKSADGPGAIRELEYLEIGKRKVWSPASKPLSQVCAGGFSREDRNSILGRFNVDEECSKFKSGSIPDRKILTGAFPPKRFDSYTAKPQFGSDPDSQMKKAAFDKLMEMIRNCDVYDDAARFSEQLMLAVSDNSLDDDEVRSLAGQYRTFSRFLDDSFIQGELDRVSDGGGAGAENAQRLRRALFNR